MFQDFINKNFCRLLIFTLMFGVMLYDTIGFDYTDELCSLLLFVLFLKYVFSTPHWEVNKMFLVTTTVFLFYLCYSFYIGTTSKAAVIVDFVSQYKPYLGFFSVYAIKPIISPTYKKLISEICIVLGIYLCIIGLAYVIYPVTISYTLKHPSRLATAVSIVALLYLYCSNFTAKEKFIFILLMLVGLCSGRSKFYGFFIISAAMTLFVKPSFKFKLNIKNIIFSSIVLALVLFFTYKKLNIYFISGGDFVGSDEKIQDAIARAALYFYVPDILADYCPFGPGFGTYGTYASGVYYSPLYNQYGMDGIYGLSKNFGSFIADTYYPALAQFGYVGICLFFLFWGKLALKALKNFKFAYKEVLMALMIIAFFMIECTTDTTITHNRGLFMMVLLGLLFSDIRHVVVQDKNEKILSSK